MQPQSKERVTAPAWAKYLAAVVTGLVIGLIVCLLRGIFRASGWPDICRILCDATFVPGILLFGIGMLSFITKEGFFDGLGFSFRTMRRHRRNITDENAPKTYYDYKESVKGKRKVAWHFVIVGLGYVAIAVVFALLCS